MNIDSNTVLLPIAYLPSVSWFYYFLNFENIVVEQYETYPKQTYRNRSIILSGNGRLNLSIPVSKPSGNKTLTKDVRISYTEKWQQNHWRAICSAYLNSPFFEYYKDEFEEFYQKRISSLMELNLQLISVIIDLIGVKKNISLSGSYFHNPDGILDMRLALNPKKENIGLEFPEYIQVFSSKHGFQPNLSILDVLFNLGPETTNYLNSIK